MRWARCNILFDNFSDAVKIISTNFWTSLGGQKYPFWVVKISSCRIHLKMCRGTAIGLIKMHTKLYDNISWFTQFLPRKNTFDEFWRKWLFSSISRPARPKIPPILRVLGTSRPDWSEISKSSFITPKNAIFGPLSGPFSTTSRSARSKKINSPGFAHSPTWYEWNKKVNFWTPEFWAEKKRLLLPIQMLVGSVLNAIKMVVDKISGS